MDVIIYSTPVCYNCKKAKEFFIKNNIEFKEIDLTKDREKAKEIVEKTKQMTVPVFEIDGEFLVGFSEKVLKEKLKI